MAETPDKNTSAELPSILSDNLSFDAAFNMDDKDKKRQISYKQKKEGKKVQLMAKINDLNLKIMKCETAFAESLTDPTQDSVELMIKLKCFKEEKELTRNLFNQLFPETKLGS